MVHLRNSSINGWGKGNHGETRRGLQGEKEKECGECTGAKRLGQVATSPSLFTTHTTAWAMKRHSAFQIACV